MAGITNWPFRSLCREFAHNDGLFVSEMVLASGLVDEGGNAEKTAMIGAFHESESPRSIQLYGTEPELLRRAVRRLIEDEHTRVDSIDLNFGCPMKKITSKGGGAAIPADPQKLRDIVNAVVQEASRADAPRNVPITAKFRLGLSAELGDTFLDCGRACEDAGIAMVGLHARYADQMYSGEADWSKIRTLQEALTIPVLGNGDIWTAHDMHQMMEQTGCAGVIIGRGCLGRPWLFAELHAAWNGDTEMSAGALSVAMIASTMLRHTHRARDWFCNTYGLPEIRVVESMRKHFRYYCGFLESRRTASNKTAPLLSEVNRVSTFDEVEAFCLRLSHSDDITLNHEVLANPHLIHKLNRKGLSS
ncbi:putative tRNA-dihydrouridine synthase [Porphyridium purpureum]|uniref:tRNA-dihydrouridine synthase n=1 Tax=Porphyridium purpureum TaxID=35688 RepID=A0A5J4Z1Y6_PORPP|nr:putative tRNA-dihydrouridine synthase [Porphyridium purpureum]|eukprot:POR6795..scf208_2